MSESSEATTGVQSVDRALTVLSILARTQEAGVSQIARELGVHKSTVFRLVSTLESHEMVEQQDERGKYRLGIGVLRLAASTTARLDVVRESRPIARALAAQSGETVNIAILSEQSALYVDQIAGAATLQAQNWVGQHIPLHATSNGKVLLSALPPGEIATRVPRLTAYTPATITSRAALRLELARVRERGYAVAVDELEVGLTALAAPVHNAHGELVASLSLSGPTFRLDAERLEALVPVVVTAAAEVSDRLGAVSVALTS